MNNDSIQKLVVYKVVVSDITCMHKNVVIRVVITIFISPVQCTSRAIALPSALVLAAALAKCLSF